MNRTVKKYDPAALAALGDGDDQFYKEMVTLFLKSTSESLTSIKLSAAAGNYKQAGEMAHKMRGPVNHIGGAELSELLIALEEMAVEEELIESHILTLIDKLSRACDDLLEQIKEDTSICI
jgi:HPt (histidine-containing phosphotransfer) domain-containing protein